MTSSLVGSEMCIRDRIFAARVTGTAPGAMSNGNVQWRWGWHDGRDGSWNCLLYTSDAADDM
eukprot:6696129-Prorocentrum_lima.AAC.1